MAARNNIRPGDLVEIEWLDASAYFTGDEISKDVFRAGGEKLFLVGILVARSRKSVIICDELDVARRPHRDFNLIPRGMIRNIKLVKKGFARVETTR